MAVDVKKWIAEKAAELGLDESGLAIAEKLLDNPKFKGDFVHFSDLQSQLERQKNEFKGEIDKLNSYNFAWQEKYDEEFAPALEVKRRLEAAGYNVDNFEPDNSGGGTTRGGQYLTPEQIEKMIADRVDPIRVGSIDYSTFIADKAVQYREEFGKRFDANAYRKFAYENRETYPTLESAYNAYTESDTKAKTAADLEKWKADEREKIRLEIMSNATLPEAAGSEGAPAFAAQEASATEPTRDQIRASFAKEFAGKFSAV